MSGETDRNAVCIELAGVTKVLGGKPVLKGLSLRVVRGETLAVVGPSGVGKSVLLKHMIRLLTPDEGRIRFEGEDVTDIGGEDLAAFRRRFGVLFQSGALLEWLTVAENVALPLREKTRLGEGEIVDRARRKLALVGLEDAMEKHPSEISGGMRKRAGLARAIVEDPRIVLYDEPTSGLDPVSARTIDALIDRLRLDLGVTSVVVTHDLHSALSIGNRIAMIHDGKIVELAAPREFVDSREPNVRQFLESQFITRRGNWEN